MNLEYKYLLDDSFPAESRVWVYQASRLFSLQEAIEIEGILNRFAGEWLSHGTPVKGAGYLFFGQFVILMADESSCGVSGCSTDSSVRIIKQIEQQFNVNMFDRTMLAFVIKNKIERLPMAQVPYAIENGFLTTESFYFNNVVQTKKALEENWIIPLKDSWLAERFALNTTL